MLWFGWLLHENYIKLNVSLIMQASTAWFWGSRGWGSGLGGFGL